MPGSYASDLGGEKYAVRAPWYGDWHPVTVKSLWQSIGIIRYGQSFEIRSGHVDCFQPC